MPTHRATNLGIFYMLISSFLFALMAAFAKNLSNELSGVEITFFRNFIGIFFIAALLYGKPVEGSGGKFWLLVFRGFIGTIALLLFFYNVSVMSLSKAMTFAKTEPIFTAILAYLLLGERLSFKGWSAVFIGFGGIFLISEYTEAFLHLNDFYGVLNGLFAALAYVSIRGLKDYYDARVVVLSFMVCGTVIPLALMSLGELFPSMQSDFITPFVMPRGASWIDLLAIGVFAGVGQLFMTRAYFYAKAGVLSTISYVSIFFSVIFGMALGDAIPSTRGYAGMALIVLSGVLIVSEGGWRGILRLKNLTALRHLNQ